MHGEYAATYCIFSGLFYFCVVNTRLSGRPTCLLSNLPADQSEGDSPPLLDVTLNRALYPQRLGDPHNKDPGSNGLSRPEANKHPQYTVLSIIVTESMESLVLNDMNKTSIVTTLDTISLHSKHWDFLFIYLFRLIMWFDWNVIHLDNEANRTLELISTNRVRLSASTAVAPAARLML